MRDERRAPRLSQGIQAVQFVAEVAPLRLLGYSTHVNDLVHADLLD